MKDVTDQVERAERERALLELERHLGRSVPKKAKGRQLGCRVLMQDDQ